MNTFINTLDLNSELVEPISSTSLQTTNIPNNHTQNTISKSTKSRKKKTNEPIKEKIMRHKKLKSLFEVNFIAKLVMTIIVPSMIGVLMVMGLFYQ